jgi:hypothetical protein
VGRVSRAGQALNELTRTAPIGGAAIDSSAENSAGTGPQVIVHAAEVAARLVCSAASLDL